jgi:hypothetical protein
VIALISQESRMADRKKFEELNAETRDRVLAELYRENVRLRRKLADLQSERDWYRRLYNLEAAKNDPELAAEDIANAVPAIPLLNAMTKRLENS